MTRANLMWIHRGAYSGLAHRRVVPRLPDQLPAIPPEVTLPNDTAVEHIAAAAEDIAGGSSPASAQIATAQDPPTTLPGQSITSRADHGRALLELAVFLG